MPSTYWLFVHPAGAAYTYSPRVAALATFGCGTAALSAPGFDADEACDWGRNSTWKYCCGVESGENSRIGTTFV
jgi:hypothetical protein